MCGIVGWADFSINLTDQISVLTNMADSLIPRGPDASGYWFSDHVAFGHRRLVVVDPEGGKQPMIRQRGDIRKPWMKFLVFQKIILKMPGCGKCFI